MKVVPGFVREQQRYSRKELRDKFSFDDMETETFIKKLKAYGILKTVAGSAAQKELTDLAEEDIETVDEMAENEDCFYVFTYVGVVITGNRVIKSYPKYIRSDSEPSAQMKQVFRVLEKYSRSKEQVLHLFHGFGENRSFNVLAVILYLLQDYFENGIYNNTKEILEVNGEGDIVWSRTIDDGFAFLEANRPYYTELITRRMVDDEADYFKRLHEYILTDCSMQLKETGLEDLFEMETVMLSEAALEDFGDREFILDRILRELSIQYHTHRQILLKTIYAYLSQNRRVSGENQGISMFGTTAFHAVWERACAEVFGNQLYQKIGQLPMRVPLAAGYDRNRRLIDLIEPEWCGADILLEAGETLTPDLISITQDNRQDQFVILDAKYCLLQLEKGRRLRGNPGVGDITKQYLYQLAYKKFITDHHISTVKNCFLMPTEGEEIMDKGIVRMEMLSALGLEDIQLREIPADMLFRHYLRRKRMDIQRLKL